MSEPELRILLLEDAAADVDLIERGLRKANLNFSTRCEQTRGGLLDALANFRPDLILSDYSMPQFTALDALQMLREQNVSLPFVLVTGSNSDEIAVACMRHGADDYVLKSDLKRLSAAISNALAKHASERERALAMAALQESQERFRQFAENIRAVIWLSTPDKLHIIYVNPGYERIWMRPCSELYQHPRSWLESVHPEDRARVEQEVFGRPAASPLDLEYRIVRPDGSVRWIHDQGFPVRNAEGQVCRVAGFAEDITQRKGAEEALRQKEASLREAQRVGQVGSWELDLATNRLTWSEGTYRIFGRSPDEFTVTRESFLDSLHPADREPTRRAVAEALEQKKAYRVEHRILRPDGSQRWLLTQAELVLGGDGQPTRMFGTVHDLTERRELEEQFHQSQKMEAIGLLAGGVAHDFNNLLTVIRGQTEMVLADEKLSPEGLESLRQVVGAVERAANLTNQLLTFSRKQPAHLRPLDLNIVISNLTKMLRRIIGEDIDLQVRLAPSLPLTNADPGMIEQVLMNCAVNARDAMPRGGQLIIATEAVAVTAEMVARNSKAYTGRHLRLSIQDTGSGIPPAVLSRIFEPFFTTKGIGKGTGLGLATVYGIVEQHRGWIDVQSSVGHGTDFSVYLPAPPGLERSAPAHAGNSQVRGGVEKILLVEDDPALRHCIGVMLHRLGYEVEAATTGLEAVRIWEEKNAAFDLLLTDAVMPSGFGGWDLARELRIRKSQLRAIIVSGYNHESAGQEPDDRIYFLAKPFTSQALAEAVRKCLDAP